MDGAKERRSNEVKSDGATERQMDIATKQIGKSNGANKRRRDRKTKRISAGRTERRSDSNKTKISRLLNCYRKIHDSRDLEQGFSHAPTVGVLEKHQ